MFSSTKLGPGKEHANWDPFLYEYAPAVPGTGWAIPGGPWGRGGGDLAIAGYGLFGCGFGEYAR